MSARELKPCPFCGGRAERFTIVDDDEVANIGGDVITCQQCNASSQVQFGEKATLAEAWNRRTDLPPGYVILSPDEAAQIAELSAERDLLQDILDSRPAINAALPDSYIRWSQAIYSGDAIRSLKGGRDAQ